MSSHPMVEQLRFVRSELQRCLDGVSAEEAVKRFEPMNSISWMVGHLAEQEHRYWVLLAQGETIAPDLYKLVGYGKPASTPPLDEMWDQWHIITAKADDYLNTLTPQIMQTAFEWRGEPIGETVGTLLWRTITHYWFHIGNIYAIREMLGHTDLPEFVGRIPPYRPEHDTP